MLSEASEPGGTSSDNLKLLAQARSALAEAQAKIAEKDQGNGPTANGDATHPGAGAYHAALNANSGVHAPQGVNASSVSVFA